MFGWWQRYRLRHAMSALLDEALAPERAAVLRRAIAADPVLADEWRVLAGAREVLAAWPEVAAPERLREDLALDLALVDKPLRARYGDLLGGRLRPREERRLRAAIAADAELADELACLEAGLATWRALPPAPVPADFRLRLDHALNREDERRELARRSARGFWHRPLPRLAWAGAAVALCCGITITSAVYRPGGERRVAVQPAAPAVWAPELQPVAEPTPSAVSAAPVARPVAATPATPARRPLAPVRAAQPEVSRPVALARVHEAVAAPGPRLRVAVEVALPRRAAEQAAADEIPEPSALNTIEPAVSPAGILFAAEVVDQQF
jgi:hypothetical protein